MRYACILDNCTNTYAQVSSLKNHQRKHHSVAFEKDGFQMKRVTPDEPTTTPPGVQKKLKTQESDMTRITPLNETHENLKALILSMQEEMAKMSNEMQILRNQLLSVTPTIESAKSEMLAHVTDLRDHLSLVAKKTTKWCVVCFERENDYAFMPCRHKCVCRGCAQQVINKYKKCPICRRDAVNAQAIYDIAGWDHETNST